MTIYGLKLQYVKYYTLLPNNFNLRKFKIKKYQKMGRDMEYELLKMENEKLKMEVENLKNKLSLNPETLKNIEKMIQVAGDMRHLLSECRNEQINFQLAKQIDYVLAEARDLD